MITIDKVNESFIKLSFDNQEELKLVYEYFSVQIPGIEFTPLFKAGLTDGMKRLITKQGHLLWGLKDRLIQFCENNDIEVQDNDVREINEFITYEFVEEFCKYLDLEFEPYEHQIQGVMTLLRNIRAGITSATGSGKSLVANIIARYSLLNNLKMLLVVPNIGLVYQMESDFKEYFYNKEIQLKEKIKLEKDDIERSLLQSELDSIYKNRKKLKCERIEDKIHCISGGIEKHSDKPILISTYQSIVPEHEVYDKVTDSYKINGLVLDEYFEDIDLVLIDEMHQVSTDDASIANILKLCHNASYKGGMSGSVSGDLLKNLSIEGLIGKIYPIINLRELIDLGLATEVAIRPIYLKYNKGDCKAIKGMKYPEESKYIRTLEVRALFIAKLIYTQMKQGLNVVCVYGNNDVGDLILENVVKLLDSERQFNIKDYQQNNDLNVYYARGNTKAEKREEFRKLLESSSGSVLIGNTKVISTGINIKNLHTLVLAQLGKAEEVLMQSIGRLTRLHNSKNQVNIYDIVDDARYYTRTGREYNNYLFSHFLSRLDIYIKMDLLVQEPVSIQLT